MSWSCIAVKKPSVSANKSAFVSHLFDASVSTYFWLRSYGWRPCKAFWDHCLSTLLLYSSYVGSSFAFAQTKSYYYYYYYYYYYLGLSQAMPGVVKLPEYRPWTKYLLEDALRNIETVYVQSRDHGKMTWLWVISPSSGKWTSSLRNFLTTEQGFSTV